MIKFITEIAISSFYELFDAYIVVKQTIRGTVGNVVAFKNCWLFIFCITEIYKYLLHEASLPELTVYMFKLTG